MMYKKVIRALGIVMSVLGLFYGVYMISLGSSRMSKIYDSFMVRLDESYSKNINRLYSMLLDAGYNPVELGGRESVFRELLMDDEYRDNLYRKIEQDGRVDIGSSNEYYYRIQKDINFYRDKCIYMIETKAPALISVEQRSIIIGIASCFLSLVVFYYSEKLARNF